MVERGGALAAVVVVLVAGCSVTRTGVLRRLPEGPAVAARVVLEGETAFVTVVEPASGEKLAGRLEPVGDRRQPVPMLDPLAASAVTRGPAGPSGASLLAAGPRTLHLAGELQGEQGTVLHCEVAVEQRVRLSGQGTCYALGSGGGTRYVLVF
ncbi:MAG: hypothetical protein HXY19_01020 [Thermoanaerobaculaceae bacterium]|nr:hypothetical protein [Thermoanaerobaculaceae bacterium]